MHILVLSDFFPPQLNAGAENIALEFSRAYLQRGYKVSVITINKLLPKGHVEVVEMQGLTCYQIGFNYHEKYRAYVSLYNALVLRMIKKIIRKQHFDFAHIHNIHGYISYGVIPLLKKYNILAFMTAHDAMSVDYGKFTQGISPYDLNLKPHVNYRISSLKTIRQYRKRYNPIRNGYIRFCFKHLVKIVCVSHELQRLLSANAISNTSVIHNGLSLCNKVSTDQVSNFKQRFGIRDSDRVLMFAGRLSLAKGVNQVELLLNRLISQDPDIKLLVVGQQVVFSEDVRKNVIFTGWLSSGEMNIAYSIADITLVPSVYLDPFPTVVLESMRVGTPVLISVFSGAKEAVVHEGTGYYINPYNIDDFTDRILKILNNKSLHQSMSEASKLHFFKHFLLEQCIERYLSLLPSE